MKIKAIITYTWLVSFLASPSINAAPIQLKPVPILHGTLQYPTSKSWKAFHRDFDVGLNFLINQQFSVWGAAGFASPEVELPQQFIWTARYTIQEKPKHSTKSTSQKTRSKTPNKIYKRPSNVQALHLSSAHFGGGVRIPLNPDLVVGGYYYRDAASCSNQSHSFYHAVESLAPSHAFGLEIIHPTIQWNLSGYWKTQQNHDSVAQENNHPLQARASIGNYQKPPKHAKASVGEIAEPSTEKDFDSLLEKAATWYSAHEALLQDRWGITSMLSYVHSSQIKIFLKACYMRFPNERFEKKHVDLNIGCQYALLPSLTIAPQITWNPIKGLQILCNLHLRLQEDNIPPTRSPRMHEYLTQPLQRANPPFVFKRDFYYKPINQNSDLLSNNPENVSETLTKQMKYALKQLISCYYPGHYLTFTEEVDEFTQKNHAQFEKSNMQLLSLYVEAMDGPEAIKLQKLIRQLFSQKSQTVRHETSTKLSRHTKNTTHKTVHVIRPDEQSDNPAKPEEQDNTSSTQSVAPTTAPLKLAKGQCWYSYKQTDGTKQPTWIQWVVKEQQSSRRLKSSSTFILIGKPIVRTLIDPEKGETFEYADEIRYERHGNILRKYTSSNSSKEYTQLKDYSQKQPNGSRERMTLFSNSDLTGIKIKINTDKTGQLSAERMEPS